jgi:glycosyltransferase involved in cell wall biosynthesis
MKVSTIIAAFNAQETINQTLESVLKQTYSDYEIIVVDDGSTDDTRSILETYGSQIKTIHQSNQGAAAARNVGVARARGKYIAFLDSDDLWLPEKLEYMVTSLEENPNAALAFCDYFTFSQEGGEYGRSFLGQVPSMRDLMEVSLPPILTSTWVLPRHRFVQSGGFCDAFRGGQGFEDSWMLLKLREFGEFIYVPHALVRYRIDEYRENADKYGHALATFVSLTKERYGKRGKALIRNATNLQCRFLQSKIAHQMDRGQMRAAAASMLEIAKIRPAYFFESEFIMRISCPQNRRRLLRLAGLWGQRSATAR